MKRFVALLAACACLLFCGCGAQPPAEAALPVPTAVPETFRYPVPDMKNAAFETEGPLQFDYLQRDCGEQGFMTYPQLTDESKAPINEAIEKAALAQIDALEAPGYVIAEVIYSGAGILSVKSCAGTFEHEQMPTDSAVLAPTYEWFDSVETLTFDTALCKLLSLADLFDPENERWRGLIPDIVTLQAEKQGMTLLADVMPAADDRLFYLTADSLVIMYRPYEIATYSAGWPEFTIPLGQLSGMLAPEGPLAAMLEENAQEEVAYTETITEKESIKP